MNPQNELARLETECLRWKRNGRQGQFLVESKDFSGVAGSAVGFDCAIFRHVNFARTALRFLSVVQGEMTDVNLDGSGLMCPTFDGCRLTDCTFRQAQMQSANCIGSVISGGDWTQASLQIMFDDARLRDVTMEFANITYGTFRRTSFVSCRLRGSVFSRDNPETREPTLLKTSFEDCDLRQVQIADKLVGARFVRCRLGGSKGPVFDEATVFEDCDLDLGDVPGKTCSREEIARAWGR